MKSRRSSTPASTIAAIVKGRHGDPFAVLGVHDEDGKCLLRAFVPGADEVVATTREGELLARVREDKADAVLLVAV